MRIIATRQLRQWMGLYPVVAVHLSRWASVTTDATWSNLMEVRADFPHADGVAVASGRTVTVFNLGRTGFRLIVAIQYRGGRVYLLRLMPHAEYDRRAWVDQL